MVHELRVQTEILAQPERSLVVFVVLAEFLTLGEKKKQIGNVAH